MMLEQNLNSLMIKHSYIREIRGIGLMYVIDFKESFCSFLPKIHREIFDAGYILGFPINGSLFRFYPSLTIEEIHIQEMISALDATISKYTRITKEIAGQARNDSNLRD